MKVDMPLLPEHVSANGQEIWGWAHRMSEAMHRVHKIRDLQNGIARVGTRCGDCDKWMKSSQCPAEKNVNGMSRGPSSEAFKCSQFVETATASKRRVDLTEELAQIAARETK